MDHPSGWKRQGHVRTGYVRSHPRMSYRGDRRDVAKMNRLTAAMHEATGRFDMGAATAAELREMLGVVVLRPDGQPFTTRTTAPSASRQASRHSPKCVRLRRVWQRASCLQRLRSVSMS